MAQLEHAQPHPTPTISVVATTIAGTTAALVAAKRTAQDYGARVALLVPNVDSSTSDRLTDTTNWLVARYERIARDVGQPVHVRVCAARDAATAAALLSPANGLLFIGGTTRWLWPSTEERMAARLRRAGRDVVFVGCEQE